MNDRDYRIISKTGEHKWIGWNMEWTLERKAQTADSGSEALTRHPLVGRN